MLLYQQKRKLLILRNLPAVFEFNSKDCVILHCKVTDSTQNTEVCFCVLTDTSRSYFRMETVLQKLYVDYSETSGTQFGSGMLQHTEKVGTPEKPIVGTMKYFVYHLLTKRLRDQDKYSCVLKCTFFSNHYCKNTVYRNLLRAKQK